MNRFYSFFLVVGLCGGLVTAQSTIQTDNVKTSSTQATGKIDEKDIPSTNVIANSANVSNGVTMEQGVQMEKTQGFPSYQNTGNKALDDANYSAAKEKWIKENPELYNELSGNPSVIIPGDYKNLPGFPQYIDTGNPTLDMANYNAAKEKWISENQELYNKCLNPENK
jgi:uncharacterized membrane protein